MMKKKHMLGLLLLLGLIVFLWNVVVLPAMNEVKVDYSQVEGSRGMLSLPLVE